MANGWVAIDRGLISHWVWRGERYTRGMAWVHLITLAAWRDHSEVYRGETVFRKRGTVHCSLRWLADKWEWDRRTVARFLDELAADNMIQVEKNGGGTTITIVNYDKWQPRNDVPLDVPLDVPHDVPGFALKNQGKRETDVPPDVPHDVPHDVHTIKKEYIKKDSIKREEQKKEQARRLEEMRKRRDTVNERTESK